MEPADHSASQRAAAAARQTTTPPQEEQRCTPATTSTSSRASASATGSTKRLYSEATGHNRGPRPGEPDFGIDNPERVIGAPGATHPKDWQSDYQAGFIDHTGRDNYRPMPDHGQREAMRRQAVAKRVEEEMAAEEMEETRRRDSFAGMETVAQASYQKASTQTYIDARNAVRPKKAKAPGLPWEEFAAKSVFDDVATTIYEDAVELGKAHVHYIGAGHLDSASGSFGKNTSFTADIHDPVKGHADPTRRRRWLCAGSVWWA